MTTVTMTVDSTIRFSPLAPQAFVNEVRLRLTRTSWVRMGRQRVEQKTCLLDHNGFSLVAPRGAVGALRSAARRHGVTLDWKPGTKSSPVSPTPAADLLVTPRAYQVEAVDFLHRRVQGVILLPCGGGKTTIGIVGILTLGEPALVVVPTTDLVDQWVERLEVEGALVRRGLGDGSAAQPNETIVSTAAAFLDGRGGDVLASVGVLVVDECHRAPAPTWGDVVERCPARYRWGLTATAERADGLEWTLPLMFGPTFEPATTQDLIDQGFLRRPTVYGVKIDWEPGEELYEAYCLCTRCGIDWTLDLDQLPWKCTECGGDVLAPMVDPTLKYAKAINAMVAHPFYKQAIVALACAASDAGRQVLVLVPRRNLGVHLAMTLREIGHGAEFISSKSTKRQRAEAMKSMRTGTLSVLVATSLADEGLDIPGLDCVILAGSGRARGKAKQRAGRAARPQGQDPLVLDLVAGGPFCNQWRSRKAAYIREYGRGCVVEDRAELSDMLALFLFDLDSEK